MDKPYEIMQGMPSANDAEVGPQHTDDIATDVFAAAMKSKLARKREQGRGGWEDPDVTTLHFLRQCLTEHIAKGDMVDIANFAMMIWHRIAGERLKNRMDQNDVRAVLLAKLMDSRSPDDGL